MTTIAWWCAGAVAGVLCRAAAAAREAEDAQVRLGEVQTAATADW